MTIEDAQLTALENINFCFYDLKRDMPEELCARVYDPYEKYMYGLESFYYLRFVATLNARFILITNYLNALLGDSHDTGISIHLNYPLEAQEFEKENKDLIEKIKAAKRAICSSNYAWMTSKHSFDIGFDEYEICIEFLNNLINFNFKNLLNSLDIKECE